MQDVATVVLALEASDVVEEVMHHLDRTGRARVVATAFDDRQLTEAVRQLQPDAIVAQPGLVDADAVRGSVVLALDVRESVASLRAAIRAGAGGYFLWPSEREQLSAAVAASVRAPEVDRRRATVIAVHGARGGVGTTFVATHLAAACARRGSCLLVDGDPVYGDVSAAIGVPLEGVHTFGDLIPLGDELTEAHLVGAAWEHVSGVRVLPGPTPEVASAVGSADLARVIAIGAGAFDVVIVHLPRALDALNHAGLRSADRIIEVLSLDVLAFRAATRALEAIEPLRVPGDIGFVVNRAARGEITAGDVERVFGTAPLAVVPVDRSVGRAQDHGRLLPAKGKIGRIFDRLATRVLEDRPSGVEPAEVHEL